MFRRNPIPWLTLLAVTACGSSGDLGGGGGRVSGTDVAPTPSSGDTGSVPVIHSGLGVAPQPVVACASADPCATAMYFVTQSRALWAFYPPTRAFAPIGTLACAGLDDRWSAASMAVDRRNAALVLFENADGISKLVRVDTA